MAAIFSTFREALLLAVRNFWILVVLTIITKWPAILVGMFPISKEQAHSSFIGFFGLIAVIVGLIFDAANTAAVLGLLKRPIDEKMLWSPVWKSVWASTLTLVRLMFLLGGVALLLAIPFFLLIKVFGPAKIFSFFLAIAYLVFAKYALADPLVVNEGLGARAALRRSWDMTRGHFGYVAGCYLFLGGGMWLARWLLSAPLHNAENSMKGIFMLTHYRFDLADSFWIILAWCMYLRIKEATTSASSGDDLSTTLG